MRRRPFGRIVRFRVGKEAMADNGRWAKAEAWEREVNGSIHGSSKSVAVVQRELASASTVFGAGPRAPGLPTPAAGLGDR